MSEKAQHDEKSRSQAKREYRRLKDLGIQLVDLSERQLNAVPLSEETREAVIATRAITRNARQRQYKYLASLLSEEDVDAVRAALAGALQPHASEVATLHEAERWRDRLLSSDTGQLAAFLERYPQCDRTRVRQLVRNAKKERELDKPPRSARQLFQYLRQLADERKTGV